MMCCPLTDHCGDGSATVYKQRIVTARKRHRCGECRGPIAAGEQHERVDGLWDGEWETHRTCASCVEIRNHFACGGGWLFGQLWDDLAENFFPDMRAGGPCMSGLSVAARERLFAAKLAHDADEEDWPNAHRKEAPHG